VVDQLAHLAVTDDGGVHGVNVVRKK
jgi:hypothetical protein